MAEITVTTLVRASIETVWQCWTEPEHITQWCQADESWHAPAASNDLREGGRFKTTMAAKDGSVEFDFEGTYTAIVPHELIAYVMDDGRRVRVEFESIGADTRIVETFDPESENPEQMQQQGWQAILESFRRHTESYAEGPDTPRR
jgi:uncharacterized protein YndB with AHSA1/START domain